MRSGPGLGDAMHADFLLAVVLWALLAGSPIAAALFLYSGALRELWRAMRIGSASPLPPRTLRPARVLVSGIAAAHDRIGSRIDGNELVHLCADVTLESDGQRETIARVVEGSSVLLRDGNIVAQVDLDSASVLYARERSAPYDSVRAFFAGDLGERIASGAAWASRCAGRVIYVERGIVAGEALCVEGVAEWIAGDGAYRGAQALRFRGDRGVRVANCSRDEWISLHRDRALTHFVIGSTALTCGAAMAALGSLLLF